ncbi:hypothetical protein CDAR_562501 [Caerostris darwini]|uniref:Uncharacterized protein n=1 Tax=Caerostris darwini TaxID=1538125 RepID=A0AAV4X5L7_9ARAC|nr:hypothetical protein CDAR_562501 [Caerostris darwini]
MLLQGSELFRKRCFTLELFSFTAGIRPGGVSAAGAPLWTGRGQGKPFRVQPAASSPNPAVTWAARSGGEPLGCLPSACRELRKFDLATFFFLLSQRNAPEVPSGIILIMDCIRAVVLISLFL